jgi:hypothetical protein
MKRIRVALFTIASMLTVSVTQAQTADEIINKHIEAIGGKENLSKVKSLYIESNMDMMGTTAPVVSNLLDGKGCKTEINYNGSTIINCFTDSAAWSLNPLGGNPSATILPDEMYQSGKNAIYTGGMLLDYAAKGATAELQGKEEGAYKIKITTANAPTYYFIDSATYYIKKMIVKGELMGSPVDITTTFSDYKKTDFGTVLSYAQVMDIGQYTLPSTVTKVEANKAIDPAIFAMPK